MRDDVIYLVGGPPRVGKSTLAQRICVRHGIPWVSSDAVVQVVGGFDPLMLTVDEDNVDLHAEALWPHLRRFVLHASSCSPRFLLEGDAFLAAQAHSLASEANVRVCFLGRSHVTFDELMSHIGHNDWLLEASDHVRRNLCHWLIRRSHDLADSCDRLGLPYFDVAEDWEGGLERAMQSLMGPEQ